MSKTIDLNFINTPVDPNGTIAHKDLFLTRGIRSTASSKVLENYHPQYSATVVSQLEQAGFSTKAKLNCDAWAHGSSGENSDFGPAKNPWEPNKTPGGSSSGSATAVSSGYVEQSTGTDTGGSIRLPASFTGICGLKPTYGALSRYGIIAMASSLDSPGFFAKDVARIRQLYQITAHPDEHDATSQSHQRPTQPLSKKTLTLGLPAEYFGEGLNPEVNTIIQEAVCQFRGMGYQTKTVDLPHTKFGIAVYYLVQTTEVASNLGRYDGIRYGNDRSFFSAEAKRRIMLGTFASSAGYADKYYEKAAKVRSLIIRDFEQAFANVDVILAPVSPTPAFDLGSKVDDPLQMYLSDVLTVNANLAGIPGLSIPCGFTQSKLPVGLQLLGPRWSESILFDLGEAYQAKTKWHLQTAPYQFTSKIHD